jgi:hypothetical protein
MTSPVIRKIIDGIAPPSAELAFIYAGIRLGSLMTRSAAEVSALVSDDPRII